MSSENMTNGAQPQSKFLNHLNSYPVVSDGVETFKSNPYGRKSIDLADSAYQRFAKPVEPYLETPYSYAKPYVAKADELADSGLGHVEQRFPIMKEDTNTIVDKGKGLIWWPFQTAAEGRDYLVNTWHDEYDKTAKHKERGPGFQTLIMALISTELKVASDFFQVIADFLGPKYEEGKKQASEYVQEAQDAAEKYKEMGKDKVNEYTKMGEQKANEYQKLGEQKTEQAKQEAHKTKEDAKHEAHKTKEEAQKKSQK